MFTANIISVFAVSLFANEREVTVRCRVEGVTEFIKNLARFRLGSALAATFVLSVATQSAAQEAARISPTADLPQQDRWTVVLDSGSRRRRQGSGRFRRARGKGAGSVDCPDRPAVLAAGPAVPDSADPARRPVRPAARAFRVRPPQPGGFVCLDPRRRQSLGQETRPVGPTRFRRALPTGSRRDWRSGKTARMRLPASICAGPANRFRRFFWTLCSARRGSALQGFPP